MQLGLPKLSNLTHTALSSSSSFITTRIRVLVKQGHYIEALQHYTNHPPQLSGTTFTFPSLLKACASISQHNNHGKKLHATIIAMGLHSDPYITTSLINMYVKCGSLSEAHRVFVEASQSESLLQDVTLWNSIIDGLFRYGRFNDGFLHFHQMVSFGICPDPYSLNIILGTCCNLLVGKQIHGYVVRNMFDVQDPFLETALINMYMKHGRPVDGWRVFDNLEDKSDNVAAWNALVRGFSENEMREKSFEFYALSKNETFELGSAMFSTVLTASEDIGSGKMVHCDVIKMGLEWEPYVCTSLLSMYGRFVCVEDARRAFDESSDKGIELWNAMISVYNGNGLTHEGLDCYHHMRLNGLKSDCFTVTSILSACSMIGYYDFGRRIHGEMIKRPIMQVNAAAQSALLTMYGKCGLIEDADLVFSTIEERDEVAWGSMISGFCQNGKYKECVNFFKDMKIEGVGSDSTIMASILGASAALGYAELGHAIHGLIIKNGTSLDVFVGSALIDMYGKCRLPDMAASVFLAMALKNLVAWNSLISCYNRNSLFDLSLSIFPHIMSHGFTLDFVSITNALVAISSLTTLVKGKVVHGYQIRHNIQSDLQVENALIDMYTKCGCLKYAQCIFDDMSLRNIVTWNSMIAGYGSHGDCIKVLELFKQMPGSGVVPDDITFLALISACSHSGFTMEGLRVFHSMKVDFRIKPRMEHYLSMVDLWGRAGCVKEAYSFIQCMPIKPDKSILLCLLGACRVHGNIDLGKLLVDQLLKMEPAIGSNYVQSLNLLEEAELWDKAVELRVSMKEKGLKKNPGCSWIEIKDGVQVFVSGDTSSSSTQEIHITLSSIRINMEAETNPEGFA